MKNQPALKIVVVGAGLIGPRHAEHVNSNPSTELFGIIDPQSSTVDVARKLNTKHFESIEKLIQYCDNNNLQYPDGAIICTPNHLHVPVAAQLASYGINLLIEKPVSPTAEESKALKMFANSKNVKVLIGHHRRFNPFIVETKKHLSKLGKIVAIQGSWTLKKDDEYFKKSPWRTSSQTGGGVLLINLIHDLDLLQYMFGPIEKVYAELLQNQRDEYQDVDEGAILTLRFKSGTCGTFICSDNVSSPFNFENATGENPTVPYCEDLSGLYRVFGSQGTLSIPDFKLYKNDHWLSSVETHTLLDPKDIADQKPFDLQLNHFVEVIAGRSFPNCTVDDGISATLVIETVQKSIRTGVPQIVPDLTKVVPDLDALKLSLEGLKGMDGI